MADETLILRAAEILRKAAHPKRIILFGSYARGQITEDSDLDFLVVVGKPIDPAAEMVRLRRLLSPLRIPVDIIVVSEDAFLYWSDTPGNVFYEARTEGRVLFEAA